MKLRSLKVSGLRSFVDEATVDFARLSEEGLFAIVGPTGAGKSTLLDGIFLALFGRCPRGEPSECVSVTAQELLVRLEFSIARETNDAAPRELAVERVWRWSKKRARGDIEDSADGALQQRGTARHAPLRIEERIGGAFEPVDLCGLKAEEFLRDRVVRVSMHDFRQAVVLPQGQFDALLRARPAERRMLIASLFRTEHLGAPLCDVLRNREAELRIDIERTEEALREVSVSEADVEAVEIACIEAARESDVARQEHAAAKSFAEQLRAARDKCVARDAAKQAHVEASARLDAAKEMFALLRRALKADTHRELITEYGASEERSREATLARVAATATESDAKRALRAAEEGARVLEGEFAKAETSLETALKKADLCLALERELALLENEIGVAEGALASSLALLEQRRIESESAVHAHRDSEAAERSLRTTFEALRVDEHERTEAHARVVLADWARCDARAKQIENAEKELARAAVAGNAELRAALEVRLDETFAARVRLSHLARAREVDVERATREVEIAERALAMAQKSAMASALSDDLRPGSPCPVCGSKNHPKADQRQLVYSDAMLERALESSRRLLQAARDDFQTAREELISTEEELRHLQQSQQALEQEGVRAQDHLARLEAAKSGAIDELTSTALREALADRERAANRLESALSALSEDTVHRLRGQSPALGEDAESQLLVLQDRARRAQEAFVLLERARLQAATEQRLSHERQQALQAELEAEKGHREKRKALLERREAKQRELRDASLVLVEALPTDGAVRVDKHTFNTSQLLGHLDGYRKSIAKRRAVALDSVQALDSAHRFVEGKRKEAEARAEEATAAFDRAHRNVTETALREGFSSPEEFVRSALPAVETERLSEQCSALESEWKRSLAVYEERTNDAPVNVLEEEARAAELSRLASEQRLVECAEIAARRESTKLELRRRLARSEALLATLSELKPRAERLANIRQTLSANQLAEFAAERHLASVVDGAKDLLLQVSNERYALVRSGDGSFGILDNGHGGLVRPPSTLSGGEAFLASLTLALALSERIQMAGRTRFDFFFLDEGFGALDQVALEGTLQVLERLRTAGRVIGMISHVPGVEERMPRRLRVHASRPSGRSSVTHEP